jgi:hypothetical protein
MTVVGSQRIHAAQNRTALGKASYKVWPLDCRAPFILSPSFDNLKRLASALRVTTDFLLGRSDNPDTSAAAGQLNRDLEKLTAEDLKLTENFVEMLVKRGQPKQD